MTWCLHILGTNSATPILSRNPSAQLLATHDGSYLIDCGEGTQLQMVKYGLKPSKIKRIFLTHLHGDHIYGLPGLLSSFGLHGRQRALTIHGPEGTKRWLMSHIELLNLAFPFKLNVVDHSDDKPIEIYQSNTVSVQTIPLEHRIPTTGYLFREIKATRKILPEKIDLYSIPFAEIGGIQQGRDFQGPDGSLISNRELTSPARVPYSFAYCSDTKFHPKIIDQISNVDLLYHESTFLNSELADAVAKKHSTAAQAATIAKRASVGYLVLGHFSARYKDLSLFREEAAQIFPKVEIGRDGQQWPFKGLRS